MRTRRGRGFSLVELLIVVILIGIIAVLAVPSMSLAHSDRLAYQDAGAIMQLLRSARTHAIARGGAVLVTMHADSGDRGTFSMYEAVTNNALGGLARTPLAKCKTPTDWTVLAGGQQNPNVLLVDSVDLNRTIEANSGNIRAAISMYLNAANATAAVQPWVDVCWTPLGRSYIALGAPAAHLFDGQQPTISPIEIAVTRQGGTVRSILLPPNGMARLFSHAAVAQP